MDLSYLHMSRIFVAATALFAYSEQRPLAISSQEA